MIKFASSKNLKTAKRYAKALIELQSEELNLDKIFQDITFASDTISSNLELKNFVSAPSISKQDKKDVIEKIFKDRIDARILNFLFLLNENLRLEILEDICFSFKEFFDEKRNIVNASVICAIEPDNEQKEVLRAKLQDKLQKTVNLEFMLDSSIIGGLIIKINDTVIDLSLKKRIENLGKN